MIASPRTSSWRPVDAWRALNDAAGDLALLGAVATDEALASDLTVLADAVERELEALFASAVRWQARG